MTVRVRSLEQEAGTHIPPWWRRYPVYGYVAILLNGIFWYCSWKTEAPVLQRFSFFPLWLSFIIILDALVKARTGTSFMTRSPLKFARLFLLSSLLWWLFEALNIPGQNWHYHSDFDYPIGNVGAVLLATLNFTIVLPVVLEMAELLVSFEPLRPRLSAQEMGKKVSPFIAILSMVLGVIFLVLPYLLPGLAFFLIWLSLAFLLDPINNLMGRKSVLAHIQARDWRFFVVLPLAGLCCGFFWEMWNYFSLPKWIYTIPYVGFGKIFEMPVLGYTGYFPFAIELF